MGNADRAQIFFYCGGAFFDADRDLGLLRGGRIGADCRHGEYHRYVLNNTDGNRWLIPPAAVATGREPYMRRVLGDAWRLLWSRIFFGRRSPQIGNADRAQIFFIVGSRF